MKRVLALFFLCCSAALAQTPSCTTATCTAAGVDYNDFVNALPSSGNTNATVVVNVPTGSSGWTSQFVYTIPSAVTSLTIQGNTVVTCTGTAGSSGYSCSSADNSVIIDNYNSGNPLWLITTGSSTSFFRVTGLTIEGGTANTSKNNDGLIQIQGSSQNMRWDHNNLDVSTYSVGGVGAAIMRTTGSIAGVMDHNILKNILSSFENDIQVNGAITTSPANGDGEWSQPTPWGTALEFYMEANYYNGGYANDCAEAGAIVERYNTFVNISNALQTHATKTVAGSGRGCRASEFYHNYIASCSPGVCDAAGGSKGGPQLVWGNTLASGQNWNEFWSGGTDRSSNDEPEVPTPTGWGFAGPSPTVTSGNATWNGTALAWVSGSTFSTSWKTGTPILLVNGGSYVYILISSVSSTTNINGSCTSIAGSSCPGTLTNVPYYAGSNWDGNQNNDGYPPLDGWGRGRTLQTLNGANFPSRLNSSTGTIAWPQQELEPVYLWMNTLNGKTELKINDYTSTQNVDIFQDNASFNGTTGTGFGVLASRPSTCTAGPGGTYYTSPTGSYGVAYWATDANSGNGELYVCTATNTWTGIYQPHPYPHPLTGGGGSTVATPTFSPIAGGYTGPQTVTITTVTSGAAICYTTNGIAPTAPTAGTCGSGSTTLTNGGTVTVSSSETVEALGTLSGSTNSAIATAVYFIGVAPATTMFGGN